MKEKVCCAIVTYNCDEEFINTFDSVKKQVDKVVVIDNGSNDKTLKILNKLKMENDIELILCEENIGIAAALNKGVNYAIKNKYDWILTLDHDSNLDRNMIEEMLIAYNELSIDEKEKVVSLLPRYVELELNIEDQLNKKINKSEMVIEGITSGNLVKVGIWKYVGLFDEKLFIDLVDYDLCFRIIQKGYKILRVNTAIIFHKVGDIKEKSFFGRKIRYSNHSAVRRYYMSRNRRYCWSEYKSIADNFIKKDKIDELKELIKIVLFEDNKIKKLKMFIRGIKDFKNNVYGKLID